MWLKKEYLLVYKDVDWNPDIDEAWHELVAK